MLHPSLLHIFSRQYCYNWLIVCLYAVVDYYCRVYCTITLHPWYHIVLLLLIRVCQYFSLSLSHTVLLSLSLLLFRHMLYIIVFLCVSMYYPSSSHVLASPLFLTHRYTHICYIRHLIRYYCMIIISPSLSVSLSIYACIYVCVYLVWLLHASPSLWYP